MASSKRKYLFIGLGLFGVLACIIVFLLFSPSGYPLINKSEKRIEQLRRLTEEQNAFYAKHQRYASSKDLLRHGNGDMRGGCFVYVVLVPEGWIGASEPADPYCGRAFYCTHKGDIFISSLPLGSSALTSYDKLNELASKSEKKVEQANPADR